MYKVPGNNDHRNENNYFEYAFEYLHMMFLFRLTFVIMRRIIFVMVDVPLRGCINGKSTLISPTIRTDGCRNYSVNLAKNGTLCIVLFFCLFLRQSNKLIILFARRA